MEYQEVLEHAKKTIGSHCKVCPECNGIACKGLIPGPGGKGTGIGFIRNYQDIKKIALQMNTLYQAKDVSTQVELFNQSYDLPVFAGPVGAVNLHYSDLYNDLTYSQALLKGCANAGTLGFTGDGVKDDVFKGTIDAIKAVGGKGIPTIKPWENALIAQKIKMAEEAGAHAIAMDVDAAGLAILAMQGKPVSPKSVSDLKAIVEMTDLPFIVKGVMTVEGALKAVEAGAYGIIVSNHGGRVLDETPSTVSVLPQILKAVHGQTKVFIDGGIRSGLDVFKMIAMGADAVLIARPFATAIYGGDAEGVSLYVQKIKEELKSAMIMTGCASLSDINESKITFL